MFRTDAKIDLQHNWNVNIPDLNGYYSSRESNLPIERYISRQIKAKLCLEKEPVFAGFAKSTNAYLLKYVVTNESQIEDAVLIAKIYRTKRSIDTTVNPSDNAYLFLTLFYDLSSEITQLVMPKPIMKLTTINGYVREWVEGVTLNSILKISSDFRNEKIINYFKNVGSVIGNFHNKTYCPNAESAESYTILKLKKTRNEISNSYLKRSKLINQVMNHLEEEISTISWKNVGLTLTHGDFVHSNILITANGDLSLIDCAESRFDLPYQDVSRFIVRTKIDYGGKPIKHNTKCIDELNRNFLNSYLNSTNYKFSYDIFYYFYIFNIVQFLSIINNRGFNSFFSYRDWYSLSILKKYVERNFAGEPNGF